VKAIQAQMQETRSQLDKAVATVVKRKTKSINPLHQDFLGKVAEQTAEFIAYRARESGLNQVIKSREASLAAIPTQQVELAKLTRDVSVSESVYKTLQEKLHEVRITKAMQLASARIVDPAAPPESPVRPRKRLNMALAIVFGSIAGLMLAFVTEYLDDTLKTPEEIESRLGVPVLGHVPLIREKEGPYIMNLAQRSSAVEAYRMLRANLAFTAVDQPFRTILVTSSLPSEGKSVTVVNLGIAYAMEGKKVILVDTDLRHQDLHHAFGYRKEPGLTDILVDGMSLEEALQSTPVEGLRILAGGTTAPNPTEVLGSEKTKKLFERLKEEADIVIVDSPPILVAADAAVLSAFLDGVLMVCGASTLREHSALHAKDLLDKAKARILGVSLNKLRLERAGYYYHYYYPYHYGAEGEKKKRVKERKESKRK